MKLYKKILLIIPILLIGLLIFGYYYTTGFTKKQQYYKCADVCRQMMTQEANIPLCKMRCEELSGYNPLSEKKTTQTAETKTPDKKVITAEEKNAVAQPKKLIGDYYCAWSWPQVIIKKSTNEEIYRCPGARPWCDYADGTYDKVGCCKNYNGETKLKTDCVTLPNLIDQ